MNRFARWLPVLLISTLLACSPPRSASEPEAASRLVAIPHPELGEMEETVRRRLEGLQAEIETSTSRASDQQAEKLRTLGKLYMAYSFPRAAEACFANAEQLDPEALASPYYLGILRQDRGDLVTASASFERAAEIAPRDLPTWIRLGRARLADGQTRAARAAFEKARAIDPASAAALHGLGRVAAADGRLDDAIESFERAVAELPDDSVAHHSLGQAYRRAGRLDEARNHLERRAEQPVAFPDPLIDEVSRLVHRTAVNVVLDLAADPRIAPPDFIGFALSKLGEVAGAEDELERALGRMASAEHRDPAAEARLHHVTGILLTDPGSGERAMTHFQQALALDPELMVSALALGDLLAESRRYSEALELYSRALELDAENREAQLKVATAQVDLGRFEAALPTLQQLVDLDPEDGRARLRLATALKGLGQDALTHWQAALELDLPDREQAFTWFNIANHLGRRGRFEQAVDAYRSAIELEPGSTGAWRNLASLLDHLGRREEAAEAYARLAELGS